MSATSANSNLSVGAPLPVARPIASSRSSNSLSSQYSAPNYAQHQDRPSASTIGVSANGSNGSGGGGGNGPSATTPRHGLTSSTSVTGLNSMLPPQSIATSYVPVGTSNTAGYALQQQQQQSQPQQYMPLTTKPAIIEYGNYRFCVHDAPTDSNLPSYVDFLTRKRTIALVRACEPTYDKTPLLSAGIRVVELPFQDGSPPPDAMIQHWLALVAEVFGPAQPPKDKEKKDKKSDKEKDRDGVDVDKSERLPKTPTIAVHCVAGLGRAPVLVCIALIESGMNWMAAVELVRKKRRGALNITQLQYLETYKPRGKKDSCNIM